MPPCSCTHSCAASTAVSEQNALATATATLASGSPAARQAAAYLEAARAWLTATQTSASRCLSAWNDPTGRANWRRSFTYPRVMSRQRWDTPTNSAASTAAPAFSAASNACEAAEPDAISVAGASSNDRSHSCRVMSSDTTGALATPEADMSTRYRPCGTPSAGTTNTLAGSASATPLTVPRSRATPISASPGRRPATRTDVGNPLTGAVANDVARATVTSPPAIRRSRSAAARAGVNGVPAEAEAVGFAAAMLSSAVVATTALPRNGTGATALPSASAAEHASR